MDWEGLSTCEVRAIEGIARVLMRQMQRSPEMGTCTLLVCKEMTMLMSHRPLTAWQGRL